MKRLKFIIIAFLTLALILVMVSACTSAEPEATEEPATEEETIVEEGPAVTEEPEVIEEEPVAEEEAVEGEPELLWVFEHEDLDFKLNCVAVSPDGETLTVGSYLTTYTHQLYDGTIINVNTSHRHSVEDIDFSPDGSVMGVGLGYYGAVLINVADDSVLHQLHGGYDNRLAFSPDGEHVATGNRNGTVWIWQVDDGEEIAAFEEPDAGYMCDIDYHPSGKLIASSRWEGVVHIWDVEKEQLVRTLDIDTHYLYNTFQFSPDGEVMAGLVREDWDYIVRLWTVDEAEKLAEIPIPKSTSDLSFSPDGSMLAIGSIYMETTIWDAETGTLLYTLDQTIEEMTDGTRALSFTQDGGHLAVVRNDGPLEFWRLPGAEPLEEPVIDIKEPPPLPGDVLFDTGSSELKAEADTVLEELANDLYTALPEAKITFIGHTDSRGDAAPNLQLSIDRATAVRDWFENWAKENGVDGWELLVDGKGDTELKVSDVDSEGTFREEAGKLNRRVEIEIEDAG